MEGVFKWYNSEKGFGFIKAEEKEYFVHYSQLPQGQANIKEEDAVKVEFDAVDTDRGVQAQNIKFLNSEE